jgi:hypothetical protein
MELSKLVEEILKITNESPCGWLDMDSVESGEILKLLIAAGIVKEEKMIQANELSKSMDD